MEVMGGPLLQSLENRLNVNSAKIDELQKQRDLLLDKLKQF